MGSIADQLRAEDRARMAALSPEERVALSLRLGDQGMALLCAATGLTPAEARRLARAQRNRGRRPSRANSG